MLENFDKLENPLESASVYINAYENTLAGKSLNPEQLLNFLTKGLITEKNEMNLRPITGYISNLYWTFISAESRSAISANLENTIWQAMEMQTAANNKKILFTAYQP